MRAAIATFHHGEFAVLDALREAKSQQGIAVSLCIPTLNEEDTIGEVVSCLRSALQERVPLLDEVAVVDSGSSDRTREVAAAAGAEVHLASEILPEAGPARGKGENIWKAVHQLRGDILCFVDGDVRNMHPRFVYGPLGVLLRQPQVSYVKGFYDRPHAAVEIGVRPAGGGRVTEALVRPLFSLFFPELAGLVQPLAGEYAARRSVLEAIAMPSGYGVETAHLIDVLQGWGAGALAQCDLDERIHRHQDTASLGRMSFSILRAFLLRARRDGILHAAADLPDVYRQFVRDEGVMRLIEARLEDLERPPLRGLAAYRERHPR
ncbi:MAG TPA: glucosyl-3-phosphoglycerate synthase [Terrimicrobiaceae bacterium]|nr:glucosyl-3-phosphoglycerate synthase [Terrimicrobiaceae bacterium]